LELLKYYKFSFSV